MGDHGWEGTYANYAPAIAAHVRNAANMVGSNGYIEVAFNQIAEWDPAIVFINTSDLATLVQEYEDNQELFDSITAIRDNKVYTQPFYNSNGTNVETGICEAYFVGATVYPDAFADVDLDALYTDIFETMLDGFDFYSYMKEQGRYFGQFPFAQER